jgi:hypothetical protein
LILRGIIIAVLSLVFLISSIKFYKNVIKYKPVKIKYQLSEKKQIDETDFKIKEIEWEKEITDKNLFSPDRSFKHRAEDKVEKEEPLTTSITPDLTLKGIVLNQYNEYIAYIKKGNEKTMAVRAGDQIDNIKVLQIREREVVLEWEGQKMTLSLRSAKTTD